jgi:hypothetical protein
MKNLLAATAATASLLLSNVASAIPVEWTVDGVKTQFGGSLTGSFTYDADLNLYSNVNITYANSGYSHGQQLEGTATTADPSSGLTRFITGTYDTTATGGSASMSLVFNSPYPTPREGAAHYMSTNAGSVVSRHGYYDTIISGRVIGSIVPIPAAVWLFGSGLALLGWFRRTQTA